MAVCAHPENSCLALNEDDMMDSTMAQRLELLQDSLGFESIRGHSVALTLPPKDMKLVGLG